MKQEQTRQTGSEEAAPVHGAQGTRPRRTHTPRWALSVTVTLLGDRAEGTLFPASRTPAAKSL